MNFNQEKLNGFENFMLAMLERGLADEYGLKYTTADKALSAEVMYFHPLICAPSDRREVAKWIIGSTQPGLKSVYNRVCNIFITYFFGPASIYSLLSGEPEPADAWVDFERVASDPSYVTEIAENIKYGKSHGLKLWTTTELHTSLQTEARNYCRLKHNEPTRPASPTDLIEWVASWIKLGVIDKMLEAKTLRGCYDAITSIRGVGPYYAGNPAMLIAALPEVSYDHIEAFCAPGAGAIKTLEHLFGKKLGFEPAVKAIAYLFENQQKFLPKLFVPDEFQNLKLHYGNLFKENQTVFTCNSFEVGLCQYSVYQKFCEEPEAIKRRLNPPPPNLEALRQRKLGNPLVAATSKIQALAQPTAINLLAFDD
jgi:hypothetical protein